MKKEYDIEDWIELINSSNMDDNGKKEKIFFVKKAYENNVPVIFDLGHLALLLGLKVSILTNMIRKPISYYRRFTIPKRSGGRREIVTPQKSLLEAQKWICKNILNTFEIHNAAYAYVINRNVAQNARIHIGSREMLKIDLKEFFPSINIKRVRELFNRKGYSIEIAGYLSYLCCLEGKIPQGSGSSPTISNIILNNLDKRISKFCVNQKVQYSRYADDLTFSGSEIPNGFEEFVITIIQNEGFSVNDKKLKFYSKNHRKLVTGILVTENEIRLQKSVRREIEFQVHYLLKFGVLDQIERYNDIYYTDRILGRLGYWRQIEPKNQYVLNSIKQINLMQKELTTS